jgi:hypothetical protein
MSAAALRVHLRLHWLVEQHPVPRIRRANLVPAQPERASHICEIQIRALKIRAVEHGCLKVRAMQIRAS